MTYNVLFLHQNFPGQYKLLARTLAELGNYKVVALGQKAPFGADFGPIEYEAYTAGPHYDADLFPPLTFFSEQVRRGDIVRWRLVDLKQQGFEPDLCFVHPAWGEALFIKDVFPNTKIVSYLEYYYRGQDSDLDFDAEFQVPSVDFHYVSLRNLPMLQAAALSDRLVSPTRWQADTFPVPLRNRITVLHEGIDTDVARPGQAQPLSLPSGETLAPGQILITFVARSMEPYRGFHSFMRALPTLQALLPDAHFAIVGKEQPSYGRKPKGGGTWQQLLLKEVGPSLDHSRIHFLGTLPYGRLINLFRLSTVHVYLTYPFVLSWSLLDAMATGCTIVGSATDPVREVIRDGENGVLVDFFDVQALAHAVAALAQDPARRQTLALAARQTVVEHYDFKTVTWPAFERLIQETLTSR
jgi:glycosyltransferase involved in cell wall biosynthesis